MPPKRKPAKILEILGQKKKKGKEKAKDTASYIPADFFENEEYEDFQAPIRLRLPPPAMSKEQRDIEEATRLSLQIRPAAESVESSSSASVRPTPLVTRSNVIAAFDDDDDFQEPIPLRPRTAHTTLSVAAPVQAATQSTGMAQEFGKVVSLTPSTPSASSSGPVHTSEKIRMKQARFEAKRKAIQESSTSTSTRKSRDTTTGTEARGPRARRTKFVIKSKLETMPRAENFNQDQRNEFLTEVCRVVRHVSDVTCAASLFLNWLCLRLLRKREAIPRLTHKLLYNFAALFVGQGKNADAEIRETFIQFSNDMEEAFNREQQFPNIQYTTILTIVMRSFETLIENHVGTNFKPKTLRYLFTRLSDTNEFPDLPFPTGVKRD